MQQSSEICVQGGMVMPWFVGGLLHILAALQVPIYGPPGSSPASIPIATPVYN